MRPALRNENNPNYGLHLLQPDQKWRETSRRSLRVDTTNRKGERASPLTRLTDHLFQTGLPTPWLAEFQRFLTDLDTRTKLTWRVKLLEFVQESRTIIKLSKETARESDKEETLSNLILQLEERFFSDAGLAVSDSKLREKLLKDLEDFRGLVRGAKGVRQGEDRFEGARALYDHDVSSSGGRLGICEQYSGDTAGGVPGPQCLGQTRQALPSVPQQEPRPPDTGCAPVNLVRQTSVSSEQSATYSYLQLPVI